MDQTVAVGVAVAVTVAASVMAVGATVAVVGVSEALVVGDGAAVVAAVTVTGGSVGSSFVTPPPLSTGVGVGEVAGEFADVAGSVVGVGGAVVGIDGGIDVGVDAQAVMRIAARIGTIIL